MCAYAFLTIAHVFYEEPLNVGGQLVNCSYFKHILTFYVWAGSSDERYFLNPSLTRLSSTVQLKKETVAKGQRGCVSLGTMMCTLARHQHGRVSRWLG